LKFNNKYIEIYEDYKDYSDVDPFYEENWDEIEPDRSFLYWLKKIIKMNLNGMRLLKFIVLLIN